MKRISFFLAVLFSLATVASQAQISKGKVFWFGFMQNLGTSENRVYITADAPTNGVISSPLQGWSQNFTVTPGVSTQIIVPDNISGNYDVNAKSNKAIHIVTDECVSVFAHNYVAFTSDAEVIFPVNSVGNDYIVTSYYSTVNTSNTASPEFLIAATDGPTQVSVTLPVSAQGYTAGVPFTVSLDTGEVFQLQSDAGDLTGTRITGLNGNNFAVFGGHVCADVICTACDHLCEQMYPISTWGTEYITVPLMTRPYDIFRIVASVNGTQVTVNGGAPITLNAGQFSDVQLSAVSTINATQPISVMQYSIGASCNTNGTDDGDPFMIMLSPTSQNIKEVTFNCFLGSTLTYYLNVVAATNDIGSVTFDGASIGGSFTPVPGNPAFSSAQLTISQTDHTLRSNLGIQAYVYAYGSYESFGYSAGVRVQVPFLSIYDTTRAYCPTDTVFIALNISDTSRIIYSEWDLGDGSPHLYDTFSFWHIFPQYGAYPVKFIYEVVGACTKDTLIIDTIKILGPEPDLGGPYNLCVPGNLTIDPTYRFPPDSIFWTVGTTSFVSTDTNFVLSFFADRDTVIYIRVTSDICDGFDTAYVYVGHDTAGFTFANACEGMPVVFTNTSQTVPGDIYTWEWDYGDGTTAITSAPTHSHFYTAGGSYNVKLKLTSPAGCTDSITHPLTIYAQPYAWFIADPVCNDSVLTPTDSTIISSGTVSYQWDFGDGSPVNTSPAPSHTYAQSGGYLVSLIASSPGCSDTTAYMVNINIGAEMAFTAPSVCWGNVSTFTDASINNSGSAILAYNWVFDDGNTGTGQVSTNNYANSGTYNVKLVHDYGFNCFDSITRPYFVNASPTADFTVPDLCNTGTITPVNNTIAPVSNINYEWLFGDGTAVQTGNAPPHTYAVSGNYTIQLIATSDSACADTVNQPITVIRGTVIAFTAPPVCEGAPTVFTDQTTNTYNTSINSYTWDFADGNTASTQNTTHTYAAGGTYNVELKLDYGNNCADSITQQVVVNANPVAAFTIADECNDSVATPVNTTTGATAYTWNFGDGSVAVAGNAPAHTYPLSNTYTVQLIAVGAGNCSDTATNPVRVIIGTDIAFSTAPVCEGAPTVFTNQTTNPYATTINSYNWDFGDGNTAATPNASNTYAAIGNYNVELKLDYGNNCLDSLSQVVTVNANPVAAFTVADVCNDSVVAVVNTSTGAASYAWLFGDGSAVATGANPTHTYNQSGTYTISLATLSAAGCTDTVSQPVQVIIGTAIAFNAPAVCEGAQTVFTDQTTNGYNTTINGYTWTLGDGNTAATQNTTHTYAAAGSYNVELRLDYGNGCADSLTKQVVVNTNPVVDFTATIPCNGTAVQYTDATTSTDPLSTYAWQFGDGNTSVTQNPAHLFTSFGTYNTKLVVTTTNGCTDSITKPTDVLEVGTAQFSVAPVCFGDASNLFSTIDSVNYPVTSYNWDLGQGTASSTQTNPVYTYTLPGTYTVTLIAAFANGCADTTTGTALVNALPVMSAAITNVSCFDGSDGAVIMTPVSGQPSFNYAWSTNPANTPNNTNVPVGTYNLTVTDGNTCTMQGSYLVTQPTELAVDTQSAGISCYGYTDGTITVTPSGASGPYSYAWNNGQTGSVLQGIGAGNYDVTVTDAEGCSVLRSFSLENPLQFSIIKPDGITVDLGKTVTLTADYQNGNPVSWLWSPADNMTCPTCQTTEALTYNNMRYTVIAVTDRGCLDTAVVNVVVDPKRTVFVPNGFSPNSDGANDYFEVFGNKEAWKQFEVQVFNRLGEKVFESTDMNFKWDGTYKGVLQNPSVFVYVVKIIYLDNFTDMQYTGGLTLIR